ncbi:MAG: flagellar basal body rod protein FlgB [Burkholderiaceae bacterium]|nr:flagellar basal body rod protein FlgB [Burkholderiaceae bacterium]
MVSRLDEYFSLSQTALNLRAQRQQLLASNIANADTPNYKARDIDFQGVLRMALENHQPQAVLRSSNPGQQQANALAQILSVPILYRGVQQGAVDGNTVDMDTERNQFADNALRYEAMLTLANSDAKTMLAAVQGGS